MNILTVLHKHTQGTCLCTGLIPLFETAAPEDVREVRTGGEEY